MDLLSKRLYWKILFWSLDGKVTVWEAHERLEVNILRHKIQLLDCPILSAYFISWFYWEQNGQLKRWMATKKGEYTNSERVTKIQFDVNWFIWHCHAIDYVRHCYCHCPTGPNFVFCTCIYTYMYVSIFRLDTHTSWINAYEDSQYTFVVNGIFPSNSIDKFCQTTPWFLTVSLWYLRNYKWCLQG